MDDVLHDGTAPFEDSIVPDASLNDIDMDCVTRHAERYGYGRGGEEYLVESGFMTGADGKWSVTVGCMLLFGRHPQRFLPRARVRFLRITDPDGSATQDEIFGGRLTDMLERCLAAVQKELATPFVLENGTHARLELPAFCWREMIVNALGHRDWSVRGADVMVLLRGSSLFVRSPGALPGCVSPGNRNRVHLARNPRIFDALRVNGYARELGEGMARTAALMDRAGLPAPLYRATSVSLQVELCARPVPITGTEVKQEEDRLEPGILDPSQQTPTRKTPGTEALADWDGSPVQQGRTQVKPLPLFPITADVPSEKNEASEEGGTEDILGQVVDFCRVPRTRKEIQETFHIVDRNVFLRSYLRPLVAQGRLTMTLPDRPNSPAQRYLAVQKYEER